MPGIAFAGGEGGFTGVPDSQRYLLANSLTGTGTPPAAALYAGDLVVTTTKSTLTSSANVVIRMLLAADKTAHYKEGTPVAGILGVMLDSVATNSSGVAVGVPAIGPGISAGAQIPYSYGNPGMWGNDKASGRSYGRVALFRPGNTFIGALDMTAGGITLQHQYDDTLAGFILTTTAGVTAFTIDTNAAAADQCVRIIAPNEQDPLYNTAVAAGVTVQGPTVYFQVLGSFSQFDTGVPYSTQ